MKISESKIGKCFGEYKPANYNGWAVIKKCPNCHDEKWHCAINVKNGVFNCFKCGSGNIGKYIDDKIIDDYSRDEIITDGNLIKTISIFGGNPDNEIPELKLPNEYYSLPDYGFTLGKRAMKYLLDRNITKSMMKKYGMGYCVSGRYNGRVILPVYQSGKLVYFQARDFLNRDNVSKYYDLPVSRSRLIFNLENVEKDYCIICEGYFGALSVGGVSIFGKYLSGEQIKLIKKRKFNNHVLLLDSGTEKEQIIAADKMIAHGLKNIYVVTLKKGQPDDYGRRRVMRMIEKREPYGYSYKLRLVTGIKI